MGFTVIDRMLDIGPKNVRKHGYLIGMSMFCKFLSETYDDSTVKSVQYVGP